MKQKRLAFILDMIISRSVMGILLFIWCRYFIKSLWPAALVALTLLIGISAAIEIIMAPRRKRKRILEQKEEAAKAAAALFTFNELSLCLEHFDRALKKNRKVKINEKCLLVEGGGDPYLLYPHYTGQKLTNSDLTAFVVDSRKYGVCRLAIICGSGYVPSVKLLASEIEGIKVSLIGSMQAYDLLLSSGAIPAAAVSKQKRNYKEIARALKSALINRKRAKGYIMSSIVILISSLFVRMSIYYLIFSSPLLALSLACFFVKESEDTDTAVF